MNLSLDASALLAYLRDEKGADVVCGLIVENSCFAHAINICEVYYGIHRESGPTNALNAISDLESLGVVVREDMDPEIWQDAGRIKADIVRISIADCFCIALARRLQADVVTSDHHEFDKIAQSEECGVRFIR